MLVVFRLWDSLNCYKHAFPSGQGEIYIDIHQDKKQLITIKAGDNGIGLPPNLDLKKTGSLGMVLIRSFVEQLDGSLGVTNKEGAHYFIQFKP